MATAGAKPEYKQLNWKESTLHYAVLGTGPDVWLLFHGFAQSKEHLLSLAAQMAGRGVRVYVFDIYFHGESIWGRGTRLLQNEDWKEILMAFLEQERIGRFSVAGYSMGGKFAISSVMAWPGRCKACWLIAADGVSRNFWYGVATQFKPLRKLFRYFVVRPRAMYKLFDLVRKMRIVDPGVIEFSFRQVKTRKRRVRLYYAWVVFRQLFSPMMAFAETLRKHEIKATVILGKKDKMITLRSMEPLLSRDPDIPLLILDANHEEVLHVLSGQIAQGDWDDFLIVE